MDAISIIAGVTAAAVLCLLATAVYVAACALSSRYSRQEERDE